MSFRVSYHDLAAKVTASVPRDRLARAIERLSTSYREGRVAAGHQTPEGRAAYLVHTLPAHVCDERRLFLDELEDVISRPELRVLALGAGPGTEAIALADAWATLAARDGRPPGQLLHVERLDRVGDWDRSFGPLREATAEALQGLDPTLGVSWRWEAPARSLVADVLSPFRDEVLACAASSQLVLLANLVSELEPRTTPTLPPRFAANLTALALAVPPGGTVVLMDRGHAPGVAQRLAAALAVLSSARAATCTAVHEREVRCACAMTRATKALYAKVKLPTTKVEDRPILNARTAWALARFAGPSG